MPATIELGKQHVQLFADGRDLGAEPLRHLPGRGADVGPLGGHALYARRSFTHRASSLTVCRVKASGLVTMCRHPM